jgi:hypothetical protein
LSNLKTIITRSQLYEKVWATPMQKLAREFGLSDVGLAKLCQRHEIPLPGRGYWARIQFGQKPERTALPDAKKPHMENIVIFRSEAPVREAITSGDKMPILKIEVATDRAITHPIARRIEKAIAKASKDGRGMLLARTGFIVPVRVSETALPRVLRILDALFVAIEEAGHTVDWPKPYNTQVKIITLGEKLGFSVTEAVNRTEHKLTKEELVHQKQVSWWHPPQWDDKPSGRLRFALESCEYSYLRHLWKDGKRQILEDCVGEIFTNCEITAKAVKRERERQAELERLRIEGQRREAEAAARKAEYDRRAEAVKKLAHAWKESKLIKEFVLELQETLAIAGLPESEKKDLELMIEWSTRHADYVDPLTDLKWVIRQFKNPPWVYGF